jgi:hypothetical protein
MQQAASLCGIDPAAFWFLTYRDIDNAIKGHQARTTDEWRRARLISYMIYATNTDKNRKDITEWLPLEGDPKPKRFKPISKKDYERIKQMYKWQT